ncbi:MAG: DUF6452 family protein [Cytophagales bacterium]|mgnify:CR=1 FL=1|nr:DUF6452 family protein [Cytophagales bacterium]
MVRLLFPGMLALLFSACLDDPDCVSNSTNIMRISLKRLDVDSARTVKFFWISASGTDSVFHQGDSVSVLRLPVNTGATATTYKFYYETKIDSLVVGYRRKTKVVSPECGAFPQYENLAVLSTSFVEVKVITTQLAIGVSKNLEIKL